VWSPTSVAQRQTDLLDVLRLQWELEEM